MCVSDKKEKGIFKRKKEFFDKGIRGYIRIKYTTPNLSHGFQEQQNRRVARRRFGFLWRDG